MTSEGPPTGRTIGIHALDRIVPPVPRGGRLVFVNEPGVELAGILSEAAASHLADGCDVVYVCLERSPDNVRDRIEAFGGSADTPGDLVIADAFSAMLGTEMETDHHLEDPEDPEALTDLLIRVADEHPDAFVIVDSLSGLVDRTSMGSVRARFKRFADALTRFSASIVAFTAWPYEDPYEDMFKTFEGQIHFGRMQSGSVRGAFFRIERIDWGSDVATGTRHLYEVMPAEGLRVYIPKIVVTGPSNAGKSSFVEAVSDEAVSVDRLGTTVALDHGHVTLDGITADLYGTPGQVRFDPMLRAVVGKALGAIVLVDSARPSSFARARDLLQKTHGQGLPTVLVASKQDLPDALAPDALASELPAPDDLPVMSCSTDEPATCEAVLERVLEEILEERGGS